MIAFLVGMYVCMSVVGGVLGIVLVDANTPGVNTTMHPLDMVVPFVLGFILWPLILVSMVIGSLKK